MNLSLELHRRRSLCANLLPTAPLEPLSALQQCLAGDLRIAVRRQDDRLHLRTLDGDPCTLEYADGYRINRLLRGLEHVTAQHWQKLNLSLCRRYMSMYRLPGRHAGGQGPDQRQPLPAAGPARPDRLFQPFQRRQTDCLLTQDLGHVRSHP